MSDYIKSFIYILGEVLPVDGNAHLYLTGYYFKLPYPSADEWLIIYLAFAVGLLIYFSKDVYIIIIQLWQGMWSLLTGKRSLVIVCKDNVWFNFALVVAAVLASALFMEFIGAALYLEGVNSYYFIAVMLMITAVILSYSQFFTLIKVNGKFFNLIDAFIFMLLQALSEIPGLSRTALIIAVGTFIGLERRHAAKLCFISLIPILLFKTSISSFRTPDTYWEIFSDNLLLFFTSLVFVLIQLRLFFAFLHSIKISSFNWYLAGLGIWTILDVFFAKRGL